MQRATKEEQSSLTRFEKLHKDYEVLKKYNWRVLSQLRNQQRGWEIITCQNFIPENYNQQGEHAKKHSTKQIRKFLSHYSWKNVVVEKGPFAGKLIYGVSLNCRRPTRNVGWDWQGAFICRTLSGTVSDQNFCIITKLCKPEVHKSWRSQKQGFLENENNKLTKQWRRT